MSTILTTLTTIVTAVSGYVGTWLTIINDQPLLLLFVLIPLVGIGIGLIKRLVSVN